MSKRVPCRVTWLALTALLSLAPAIAAAATTSSLQAAANGRFVSAENAGADPLKASRDAVGTWEQFQVLSNTDGTVSFLSAISGKYVSADLNQGAKLIADRPAVDAWEKFRVIAQANGTIALQAVANGRYVSADLNLGGVLVADRATAQGWEQFTLAPVGTAPTCSTLPAAPAGLVASAVTASGLALSWSAPAAGAGCSLTGYRVFQGGSQVASPSTTAASLSGLAASTTYSFAVAAVNAFGVGPRSAALSVTTSAGGGTLVWRSANLTNYTSYPDPGSDECLYFNGCLWAGQFAFVDGKQSEDWVRQHNIIAVHSKDASQYKLKTFRLRQGTRQIDATVYDMCSDSDCDGCCSQNCSQTGFLIDIEKYTMERFGSGDGVVEWTCLDCP